MDTGLGFWQYFKQHFNFFNDDGYATIFAMMAVLFLSISRVVLAILIKKRVDDNMRAIWRLRNMFMASEKKREDTEK